ncbi:MAG: LamG domain-containing protein [archaeon]
MSPHAQGTLEYLVVIAVVVVISLVVVGLLVTQTDSASSVSSSAFRVSQVSGLISVSEAVVGVDGNGLVTLTNNSGGALTVTKISVGGIDSNYSDVGVYQGSERVFSLSGLGSGCSCVGFEGQTKTCEVIIFAESEYGLEKQFPVSVLVNCVSSATATNPSIVVQPVTESGGESTQLPLISFVDPTPADGNSTTNTYVDVNVSITSAPDLNEFIWNWNDTNYSLYDDSLVLMLNFDNVSALDENSTNVTDVSEYENNGTVNGATWISGGKYGGAYSFDGTNDYISAPDNTPFESNPAADGSISMWIKTSSTGNYQNLIGNRVGETGWFLMFMGNPDLDFSLEQGSWSNYIQVRTNGGGARDGSWHHIVLVWNGSEGIDPANGHIYLDSLELSHTGDSSAGTVTDVSTAAPLTIGATSDPSIYFNGFIDEVHIYNRALSVTDVNQLYYSNLRKYDTDKWIFDSNQQNLSAGDYNYQAFVSDANVGSNQTEERSVTIVDACPATGGTETIVGDYCIHTFLSSGTFTVPMGTLDANVLIVAGGGGGGRWAAGGGGGGGVISTSLEASGENTVVVGAGGAGATTENYGYDGSNSSFGLLEAIGGAGGGEAYWGCSSRSGGSGAGGASQCNSVAGGSGTAEQGNNGGYGGPGTGSAGSGGGGGAGAVGADSSGGNGGNGGIGFESDISGATYSYGGGGGGGGDDGAGGGTGGTGGADGGGNGGTGNTIAPTNGIANSGGGGGGDGVHLPAGGGNGGSGIVIVRYAKVS